MPDFRHVEIFDIRGGSMDRKFIEWTLRDWIRCVRELAVIFTVCYLVIQVFSGDLSLNFSALTASELVSFLLAFFSISLSAAFYFAATNSSNKFYDYVNKFNSQSSELLGRLEERLNSLHEKQGEIGSKIDLGYLNGDRHSKEAKNDEINQQIMELQAGLEDHLKELIVRAGLDGVEKARFESEIKEKDKELASLRREQGKITAISNSRIRRYFLKIINEFGLSKALKMSPAEFFSGVQRYIVPGAKGDLIKLGYAELHEDEFKLTKEGESFLVDILLDLRERELV